MRRRDESQQGRDRAALPDNDDAIRPLPDRLLTELTAHRTLALRDALAADLQTAFSAAFHALFLRLFYSYGLGSCLEIEPKSALFFAQAPGLADIASAHAIEARHARWLAQMPREPGELWLVSAGFDADGGEALFTHCIELTVNAVQEAYNRRLEAIAHADRFADVVSLDMATIGSRPTAEAYLGRGTKRRILAAVREARGARATERIAGLKEAEMATAAEELLAGTGGVAEPLRMRTPGKIFATGEPETDAAPKGRAESATEGGENGIASAPPPEDIETATILTAAIATE